MPDRYHEAVIPGVMIEFLRRASVAFASTRDRELVPHLHVVTGWIVEECGDTVRCLIPESHAEGLGAAIAERARFALAAEIIGPHHAYQFKGALVDERPLEDADRAIWRACRARFVQDVHGLYGDAFTDAELEARCPEPTFAVRFRVEEIYVQTPGPAAGHRLYPPEGP